MKNLKERRLWLLWKKQERNGKTAKVPFAANGGKCGTSEEYKQTWVTYQEAEQAAKKFKGAGVGFVIPQNLFFLDIDHQDQNDPVVKDILSRFNTYTEYSVSGDGIHVYGLCDFSKLPTYTEDGRVKLSKEYYAHHPTNGMELYVGQLTNRYAAYTGNAILDVPLADCTTAVIDILNEYMRKPEAKAKEIKTTDLGKRADSIIQALRRQKNGAKFSSLFDYGAWGDCTDHSELDLLLCSIIAFHTKDNRELLDTIFRKSVLYRDKWEREDYREQTITKAIAYQSDPDEAPLPVPKTVPPFIKPVPKTVPPFIKINENGVARVSAPLLAKYAQKHLHYLLVRNNATQNIMTYLYKDGVYSLYDNAMLQGVIKGFIAAYDEELVKMSIIKEVISLLLSDVCFTHQDDLDLDESVINFQNGLLRVTGDQPVLMPHNPQVWSTIQLPCKWNPDTIPTPIFDQYMSTLTNGDKAVEQLLLEYMGACISNVQGWRMKKTLFLVGDGNTGKSQFKLLIERLLGRDNYVGIDLSEIEARFGTGTIHRKRLIGSADMSFMSIKEAKTLKRLTGGDSIQGEIKNVSSFTYVFKGLSMFCVNAMPHIGGDNGEWVLERLMLVECPNVIPLHKQDKELLDKMYAERDGIVQKAVHALRRVIANGYRFSEPESVKMARLNFQKENSTVISFFEECMGPWPDDNVDNDSCTTGQIHTAYREWCRRNNNGYAKSAKEFRDELAAYLFTTFADMSTRRKGNTFYKDYTLTKEARCSLLH